MTTKDSTKAITVVRAATQEENDRIFAGSGRVTLHLTGAVLERSEAARVLFDALSGPQLSLVRAMITNAYTQGVIDTLRLEPRSVGGRGRVLIRGDDGDIKDEQYLLLDPLSNDDEWFDGCAPPTQENE